MGTRRGSDRSCCCCCGRGGDVRTSLGRAARPATPPTFLPSWWQNICVGERGGGELDMGKHNIMIILRYDYGMDAGDGRSSLDFSLHTHVQFTSG